MPRRKYNCGVESNCLGTWEIYTYVNGKPAGTVEQGRHAYGRQSASDLLDEHRADANKAGDKITVAILASVAPGPRLIRKAMRCGICACDSPFPTPAAGSHFWAARTPPASGNGLWGVREKLGNAKG